MRMKVRNKRMNHQQAIEELKYDCDQLEKAVPCDTSWGQSINTAYGLAIKALKKQIPKKFIDDTVFGTCPNCGREFNSELINKYDMKYCLYCGQALDVSIKNAARIVDWIEHLAGRFNRFE